MGPILTDDLDLILGGIHYKRLVDAEIGDNPGAAKPNQLTSQVDWDQYYSFPRFFLPSDQSDRRLAPFVLQPSLFFKNRVPPVIYFETKLSDDLRAPIGLPKRLQVLFKWKISSITPNSIRNCVNFMKFDAIKPSNTTETYFIGCWYKHMLTAEFSRLDPWRKVNHYPGSFNIGRKDKLWTRLKLSSQKYGDSFGTFHPTTFILPRDYDDLIEQWSRSPSKLFIIKPPASARGNGIKVINDISQIPASALKNSPLDNSRKSLMIVQQYISNPCLLENGQKFDLRVYVLLTSVDPLRVYVYDEGLVRFASSKYDSEQDGIIDQYMHLTNYFVNKKNQDYQINNDCESLNGCKWTLTRFWRYLKETRPEINTEQLWEDILDIIVKTVVCCEGPIFRLSKLNCRNDYSSFELFGFDIILDDKFKPWILEVNITPSLKSESDLDTSVKYKVIKDMFNLVGYHLPPPPQDVVSRLNGLCNSGLFFDERLYLENLCKQDKLKHQKFVKRFKLRALIDDCEDNESVNNDSKQVIAPACNGDTTEHEPQSESSSGHNHKETLDGIDIDECILDNLTQNEARVMMISEDELSRCGNFRRVYPSSCSTKYLQFFDKPRYNDLLLDAWEQKYGENRLEGIRRLSKLARFLN